jgi:hypothetical protein
MGAVVVVVESSFFPLQHFLRTSIREVIVSYPRTFTRTVPVSNHNEFPSLSLRRMRNRVCLKLLYFLRKSLTHGTRGMEYSILHSD